jgi:hypothetical protein
MKKTTLLMLFLLIQVHIFAQERTITGKIVDETGTPLIGASIQSKGTTTGTISDMNGTSYIFLCWLFS